MATDWIKVRSGIHDEPETIGIALRTTLDEHAVVGRLIKLWAWADQKSCDGFVPNVVPEWIDRFVQCDGFSDAMRTVRWLIVRNGGVEFPDFLKHNTETAKQRALKARRAAGTPPKPKGDEPNDSPPAQSSPATRQDNDQTKDHPSDGIKKSPLPPLPFDSEEFRKTWDEWVTFRGEMGWRPYKPTGMRKALNKLVSMGERNAIQAMNNSMAGGWKGFFLPKDEPASLFRKNGHQKPMTAIEQMLSRAKQQ